MGTQATADRHGRTVLLAVPNAISRRLLAEAVAAEGHRTLEAATAAAALEAAQRQPPDLAVIDADLGGMEPQELAHRLRTLPGATPLSLLLLAAPGSPLPRGEAAAQFLHVLSKPVEPAELATWIAVPLAPVPRVSPAGSRKPCVLLVDDDALQLKCVRLQLERAGFTVAPAAGGREALEIAADARPDIVVSDVLMPEMDGFQFCQAARRNGRLRNVPVILTSNHYVEQADRRLAAQAGASGYVCRAEGIEDMVRTLRDCLGRSAPAPALRSDEQLAAERQPRLARLVERQAKQLAAAERRNLAQGFVLRELSVISEALARHEDIEPVLQELLASCLESVGLSRGVLYLRDPDGLPRLRAHHGGQHILSQAVQCFGKPAIVNAVLAGTEPRLLSTSTKPVEAEQEFLARAGARSAVLFPVRAQDETLGALVLLSSTNYLDQADWMPFGRTLAAQLGQTVALSRALRTARESEQQARSVFEGVNDAIFLTDDSGRVVDANPAATRLTGYPLDILKERNILQLVPDHSRRGLLELFATYRRTGTISAEVPLTTAGGEERTVLLRGNRVRPGVHAHVATDISEQKRIERQVRLLAFTDRVTELPNRTALRIQMERALKKAQESGQPLALLLIDLANFRDINSTLGHLNGDILLMQVARRLIKNLHEADVVARVGADEFAVLLPRLAQRADLEGPARKLLDALRPTIVLENVPLAVRAHMGIAVFPEHGDDAEALFRHAEMALFQAKAGGRPYVIYEPEADPNAQRRLVLMSDLQQAVGRQQLALAYQPKLNLATGRVGEVEALARWNHPKFGLVPPNEFVGLAERSELIQALTGWTLGTALRQAEAWRREGLDLGVAVNVTAHNLRSAALIDQVEELLKSSTLPPERVTLELTEGALIDASGQTLRTLQVLKGMGLHLAIDDFGAGYSSLSYLRRLPVDALKIDKSFLTAFPDPSSKTIVRAAIALAHELGLKVTAEGVETPEALEVLRSWGCDHAQGFLISPAIPGAQFAGWLRASPWGNGAANEPTEAGGPRALSA
ncbi:MAG: EAL domain-containing protein [Gammaproteobacteria bacterium]|nr:EAL domain-containing protein [Gammaproteobacteria bacterium]